MTKTLTRADLSNSVYKKIGLSLQECNALVDSVIEEVCTALEMGDAVKLSSFGTFSLRRKKQRMGRNPKTGASIQIEAKQVVKFRIAKAAKDAILRK